MMNEIQGGKVQKPNRVFRRPTLVAMLRAALESSELRFARQAALAWLSAYPGDLEVTMLHAQAVLAEGRSAPAVPTLEMLIRKDPYFLDVYRVLEDVYRTADPARYAVMCAHEYVLSGTLPRDCQLLPWAEPLRAAYLAFTAGRFEDARTNHEAALQHEPDLLLTSVIYLLLQRENKEPAATAHLAKIYQERWPDCLPVGLVLAETLLEMGNEPEAVRLLHLGVANDSTGQAARRLWGESHVYRGLWPDDMFILLDQSPPAGVAARFGWNQLASGEILLPPLEETEGEPPEPENAAEDSLIDEILAQALSRGLEHESSAEPQVEDAGEETAPQPMEQPAAELDTPAGEVIGEMAADEPVEQPRSSLRRRRRRDGKNEDVLKKVQREFEVLAKKLKQPALARTDARYPVYVILSSREGLERKYGPKTAEIIENELRRLADLVCRRTGWDSTVYFPDDTDYTEPFGLTPVNPRDPWKIKHALADLDAALKKKGEMIGALLIAGDDQVVPFHRLPNPTDDGDGEVLSDSPYTTLGANYFIPDWAAGRLPGEAGTDAGLLLEQIRQVQRYHDRRLSGKRSARGGLMFWLRSLLRRIIPERARPNFALTAAVWRRSSLAVFRPIGAPHTVMASPPTSSGGYNAEKITSSGLSYYNLHGLEDSAAWYGQRDPYDPDGGPDYPVALVPGDLKRNGHAPRFVFSEACYGGHIAGKCESDSLALKFLSIGAAGVVASTCIAYGSVSMPLIAADLLGFLFWQHLKQGSSAGQALMQAKIDLVREMDQRQGFLDGEDQKTLISFVLYGDPLAVYDGFRVSSKKMSRPVETNGVKTISDHDDEVDEQPVVSPTVMKHVKQIVSQYLPGIEMSDVHFCRLPAAGAAKETPQVAGGQAQRKNGAALRDRLVVTASKQVVDAQHTHRQYMRFTLDEKGKTLKLSVSR